MVDSDREVKQVKVTRGSKMQVQFVQFNIILEQIQLSFKKALTKVVHFSSSSLCFVCTIVLFTCGTMNVIFMVPTCKAVVLVLLLVKGVISGKR